MNTSIAERTTILVVALLLLLIAGVAVRATSADQTRPTSTVEQPTAGGGARMTTRAT